MIRRETASVLALFGSLVVGNAVAAPAAAPHGARSLVVAPEGRFEWELGPNDGDLRYTGTLTQKGALTAMVESGGAVRAKIVGTVDPKGPFTLTVEFLDLGTARVTFGDSGLQGSSEDLSPRDCSLLEGATWTALVANMLHDLALQGRLPPEDRAPEDWRVGGVLAALDGSWDAVKSNCSKPGSGGAH